MMASTAPEDFTKNIEPYIPRLSEERVARQEQVIAQQVAWAKDFRERYPKLGEAMRVLTTTEDTPSATSFETYLRGELGTYSDQTFERYEAMIGERAAASPQRNITEETLLHTVQLGGFDTLEEAESLPSVILSHSLCIGHHRLVRRPAIPRPMQSADRPTPRPPTQPARQAHLPAHIGRITARIGPKMPVSSVWRECRALPSRI